MISILYKGTSVGYVVKRIAATNPTKIKAVHQDQVSGVPQLLLRWDSKKELNAHKTLNSAKAVSLCRDKRASRIALEGLCPKTVVVGGALSTLTFPALIRPRKHYAAVGFHVVNSLLQAQKVAKKLGAGKWYASPIIKKSKEFRVFVFQGRCVQVARRYCDDPNQIAWNIAVGGKTVRVKRESWPLEAIKAAVQATIKLGLDYAAIDVIVDGAGKPYVLEANTAPGLDQEKTIKRLGQLLVWAETHEVPEPINWSSPLTSKLVKHPAKLGDMEE